MLSGAALPANKKTATKKKNQKKPIFITGFSDFYESEDSSLRSKLSSELFLDEDAALYSKAGINFCPVFPQWNRLETSQGNFDQFMLSLVIKRMEKLKELHIRPVLVLLKDSFPDYFQEQGGFATTPGIDHFTAYAAWLIKNTSHLIDDYIIFFEAEKLIHASRKPHHTAKNLLISYFKVRNDLLALKKANPEISIGYCLSYHLIEGAHLNEEQNEKAQKTFNYLLADSIFQGKLLFPYGRDEAMSEQGGWDFLMLKVQDKLHVTTSMLYPSQSFFKTIHQPYQPSDLLDFVLETARRYPGTIYLAETYAGDAGFAPVRMQELKNLTENQIIDGYCLIPESIQNDGLRSISPADLTRKKGPIFSFFSDIKPGHRKAALKKEETDKLEKKYTRKSESPAETAIRQESGHQRKKKEKAPEIENPLDDKEPL